MGGHTYTVQTVNGDPARCNVLASSSVTVTVNPLPAEPSATGTTLCGSSGTVTLLAASAGAEIDWYSTLTGGTSLTTSNSYTPSVSGTANYYAQARYNSTGCTRCRRTSDWPECNDGSCGWVLCVKP